jgi:hypothetical protein
MSTIEPRGVPAGGDALGAEGALADDSFGTDDDVFDVDSDDDALAAPDDIPLDDLALDDIAFDDDELEDDDDDIDITESDGPVLEEGDDLS